MLTAKKKNQPCYKPISILCYFLLFTCFPFILLVKIYIIHKESYEIILFHHKGLAYVSMRSRFICGVWCAWTHEHTPSFPRMTKHQSKSEDISFTENMVCSHPQVNRCHRRGSKLLWKRRERITAGLSWPTQVFPGDYTHIFPSHAIKRRHCRNPFKHSHTYGKNADTLTHSPPSAIRLSRKLRISLCHHRQLYIHTPNHCHAHLSYTHGVSVSSENWRKKPDLVWIPAQAERVQRCPGFTNTLAHAGMWSPWRQTSFSNAPGVTAAT